MNMNDPKYAQFGLVRDMLATVEIVKTFDTQQGLSTVAALKKTDRLMLTGEGSSRIFPAKHALHLAGQSGWKLPALRTEATRQLLDYDLDGWAVFAASN